VKRKSALFKLENSRRLTNKDSKEKLIDILLRVKDYTRCIVLYGSSSCNRKKSWNSKSDFDFIIIYKKRAPHHLASTQIEGELRYQDIDFDYGWYIEDFFLSLVNNKIDLHLFKSIFMDGEIIYSESNFVDGILEIMHQFEPTEVFFETYIYQNKKIAIQMKAFARSLSRLCFDYISTQYCQFMSNEKWCEIPEFDEVIIESRELGAIDDNILCVMEKLVEISKMSVGDLEKQQSTIYPLLIDFKGTLDSHWKKLIN